MKLELSLYNGYVYLGDKINVKTKFNFDEDSSVLWSGIRLLTYPPCLKELQITKEEIFTKGFFEAGEYIRDKAILIKNNVIPTIKNRNVEYELKLILRQPHPINPDDDLVINKTQKIEVREKQSNIQTKKPNPLSISISGLSINLSKDVFKPGEAIKINFSSEELKQVEIRLLQKANLVCYCDAYGQNCSKVEELPPAIAGDSRTTDMDKKFLLLKVPEIAQPSHNYLWEPHEKEFWGFKYGSYVKWSLLFIGKPKSEYGKEPIKFNVPITIIAKPADKQKLDVDLFSGTTSGAPSIFDGVSSKFQKIFKIVSIDSDIEKYIIKIKNTSKETLKGVTVKVTGLQEGLFETAPILTGFNSWGVNEEKEIVYESKQNITALISVLEDNARKSIRIQTPVGSVFF
ncbi:MAG: hypothetical protein CEE42_16455 [Promethearchaeota archaeon Loki_b31]|nr:MAG: hypothetical protein CEE42_16455 [Candidatus Lokiarchaeota archaeon Loki_b31]